MLLTTFALAVTAAIVSAVPTLHPRAFIPDQASLVSIHPKGHTDKCLGAKDGVANMHDIVIAAQNFYIFNQGWPTYILSAQDTNLCVDAGTNPLAGYHPSNGAYAKLMFCPSDNWPSPYDSPDGRKWTWHNGAQFQSQRNNFCLDNADGKMDSGNKVQIWECHDTCHPDYANQVWEFSYH